MVCKGCRCMQTIGTALSPHVEAWIELVELNSGFPEAFVLGLTLAWQRFLNLEHFTLSRPAAFLLFVGS